ncbi:MAG: carboxylating nicotinate-nucleotide diphosphorylase [Actinomycetota bacterium]|nr:carboxylating nicotinate-nucleotide diphosphorylase [Actinomycetota bacterium]
MPDADLQALVQRALAEDLGPGDVTVVATVPAGTRARASVTQKAPGAVFGLEVAELVFLSLDPRATFDARVDEGVWRDGGLVIEVEGDAGALLSAERTALNFLGRLSGIATLTARYVQAVEGTGTRILDTRKTTPGLRALEKAAVVAGGGANHRFGLFDMVLIKENHAAMAGGVGAAVRAAREHAPGLPLEVECSDLAEVREALDAEAPRILLDNMNLAALGEAVVLVDGRAETEASGGVSLETVRGIAATGLDFVSVGALTHSAPNLDLSLILEPLT